MSTLIFGFSITDLVQAVLLVPLVSAVVNGGIAVVSAQSKRVRAYPVVAIFGVGAPLFVLMIIGLMVFMLDGAPDGLVVGPYFEWFQTTLTTFDVAFWLDPLAFLFGLGISGVALVLSLFALGNRIESARFCSLLNLGLFAGLVALWAENLPVCFFGWEGAALTTTLMCSGQARHGGQTVFWLSRVSAAIFLVGLFGLIPSLASTGADGFEMVLSFAALSDYAGQLNPGYLLCLVIPSLLFTAQLPLSLWLWQAGHGKSVPFAWIATAGMPCLGIYLLARIDFLILAQPSLLLLIEIVGAVTAFVAAGLACFEASMRRVIAYCFTSQLGLILAAYGNGFLMEGLLHGTLVVGATVLLIGALDLLSSAAQEDSSEQLRAHWRTVPWSFWPSLVGALCLIGIVPLAGFFSRFEILWHLFNQVRIVSWVLLAGASGLTAVALSRLIALTYLVPSAQAVPRTTPETHRGLQLRVRLPLLGVMLLLFAALWPSLPESFYGQALFHNWLKPIYEDHLPIRSGIYGGQVQYVVAVITCVCLVVIAWITARLLIQQHAQESVSRQSTRWVRALAQADLYLAQIFRGLVIRPLQLFSSVFSQDFLVEKIQQGVIIDSVVAGLRTSGRALLGFQTGQVQLYLFWIVLGVAALVLWLIL